MGGFGSGRYRRTGGRRKCENSLPLDIRKLHREGRLVPGNYLSRSWTRRGKEYASIEIWVEDDHITLEYMQRGVEVRQRIESHTIVFDNPITGCSSEGVVYTAQVGL